MNICHPLSVIKIHYVINNSKVFYFNIGDKHHRRMKIMLGTNVLHPTKKKTRQNKPEENKTETKQANKQNS